MMLQYRAKKMYANENYFGYYFTFIPVRFKIHFFVFSLSDILFLSWSNKGIIHLTKEIKINFASFTNHSVIFSRDERTSLSFLVFMWFHFRDRSCYELRYKQGLGNVLGYVAMDTRGNYGSLHELSTVQLRDTNCRASGVSSVLQRETWALYARIV